MRGLRRFLVLAGLASVVGAGVARVAAIERIERDHVSAWVPVRVHGAPSAQPLTTVSLAAGARAQIEVCFDRAPLAALAGGAVLAAWRPDDGHLVASVRVDEASRLRGVVRGDDSRSCVSVGDGHVDRAGAHRVELAWPDGAAPEALREARVRASVAARAPLERIDVALMLATFIATLLAAVGAGARRVDEVSRPSSRAPGRVVVALALLAAAFIVPSAWHGAAFVHVRALAFALVALGVGAALAAFGATPSARAGGAVRGALAWWLPGRPFEVGVAMSGAVALAASVPLWLRVFPPTGVDAVSRYVAETSGLVSFALVAVVVPPCEEALFRGFVYGRLEGFGRAAAFAGAALAFVAFHLPQTWGNPAAVGAIAAASFVFTALRAWTGSALVACVAHATYNALVAFASLLRG